MVNDERRLGLSCLVKVLCIHIYMYFSKCMYDCMYVRMYVREKTMKLLAVSGGGEHQFHCPIFEFFPFPFLYRLHTCVHTHTSCMQTRKMYLCTYV